MNQHPSNENSDKGKKKKDAQIGDAPEEPKLYTLGELEEIVHSIIDPMLTSFKTDIETMLDPYVKSDITDKSKLVKTGRPCPTCGGMVVFDAKHKGICPACNHNVAYDALHTVAKKKGVEGTVEEYIKPEDAYLFFVKAQGLDKTELKEYLEQPSNLPQGQYNDLPPSQEKPVEKKGDITDKFDLANELEDIELGISEDEVGSLEDIGLDGLELPEPPAQSPGDITKDEDWGELESSEKPFDISKVEITSPTTIEKKVYIPQENISNYKFKKQANGYILTFETNEPGLVEILSKQSTSSGLPTQLGNVDIQSPIDETRAIGFLYQNGIIRANVQGEFSKDVVKSMKKLKMLAYYIKQVPVETKE